MKAFSIPMLYGMRIFYAKRLLRGLIEQATQTIYSEKFDFRELVNTSSRGQEGVALLRAYVAVQFAARLMAPLTQMDIDRALEAVQLAEIYVKSPVFTEIVNVHRELAEHYLSLRHIAILRGKLAHKNDEHSYEGAVYNLQRTNKGPVSNAQLSKLEVICKKMHNLNRQVEKAELKAWEKQDEQEFRRYEEELATRDLRDEVDAFDRESLRSQSDEVTRMLEAKLARLTGDKN